MRKKITTGIATILTYENVTKPHIKRIEITQVCLESDSGLQFYDT